MRYIVSTALLLILCALPASTQTEAVLVSVEGKVETRPEGGSWQQASEGDTIARGTTVSTGFDGSADIELGDSVIQVDSLTRLTLEQLVRQADTVTTRVFMDVGEVEAEVQGAEGLSNDFEVRSTQATAAVRGTVFQFNGRSVSVSEGQVWLGNQVGLGVVVSQSQQSSTSGSAPPGDPEQETSQAFDVSTSTDPSADDGGTDSGQTSGSGSASASGSASSSSATSGALKPVATTVTFTWSSISGLIACPGIIIAFTFVPFRCKQCGVDSVVIG